MAVENVSDVNVLEERKDINKNIASQPRATAQSHRMLKKMCWKLTKMYWMLAKCTGC